MISRNIDKAIETFGKEGKDTSIEASPGSGFSEGKGGGGRYIKSLIYGGLDGIITTFAVVAGVAGASLSANIVLILGFANLLADGLSMAIGDYLSTRAEMEVNDHERNHQEWLLDNDLGKETRTIEELYVKKGVEQSDARNIASILSKYRSPMVDVMMIEKLGIHQEKESPLNNALVTFFSFGFFGVIPLLAYVLARFISFFDDHAFLLASILTALTLFILGVQKVRFTNKGWFSSGMEILLIGGIAAVAAYGIGALLA